MKNDWSDFILFIQLKTIQYGLVLIAVGATLEYILS